MINEFVVGKTYRFIGDKDSVPEYYGAVCSGMIDGVPRKCVSASYRGMRKNEPGMAASFKKEKQCWDFSGEQDLFEEVSTLTSP